MKKSVEILNQIKETKEEMIALKNEGKLDEAVVKVSEIENLKKELAIEEANEEEITNKAEVRDVINTEVKNKVEVLNKALRGIEVENALVEKVGDVNGGEFLVPTELVERVAEYKRTLIPLKEKCDIIPVNSSKGSMPVSLLAEDGLKSADEMAEIVPSDMKFTEIKFGIEDYSDLVLVSNQLMMDSEFDITPVITKQFSRKAVKCENDLIFKVLDGCSAITGNDYTAIDNALNTILDPIVAMDSEIITDQDGMTYLASLRDKNDRPLLEDSLSVQGAKTFRGKNITVVRNGAFAKTGLKFYVGSLEEAVAFFDREEMSIAISNDFAFNRKAKAFLVTERIDVQAKDVSALAVVTISAPVAPASK